MPGVTTLSPAVRRLAEECVTWLATSRPFDAWLSGVEDVEVTDEHGCSDEARRRLAALAGRCRSLLSRTAVTSADRPVLSQLIDWCDRQTGWTGRANTSLRTFHDTVLQACVCLEEFGDAFDRARVDSHLAALLRAGQIAPGHHRDTSAHQTTVRLAAANGLVTLLDELESTTPAARAAAPVAPEAPRQAEAPLSLLVEMLMASVARHRNAARARLGPELIRGIRRSDGTLCVATTIERLAGLFGIDTAPVEVRRSAIAASILGPQAFFRPDHGGGAIFCGPALRQPVPAGVPAEAVFVLTVAHEVFPGHALHHAHTDPVLRPVAAVLRDDRGREGWAMWAEGMLAAADEGTAGIVHWFRIKRLLPLAVDMTRRTSGEETARKLVEQVATAAPEVFRSTPTGHQLMKTNRAYGEGYAETVLALGSAPESSGLGWRATAGHYLRCAGMRPHRAAAFASLAGAGTDPEAEGKQVLR
jgi:hypothetical protein